MPDTPQNNIIKIPQHKNTSVRVDMLQPGSIISYIRQSVPGEIGFGRTIFRKKEAISLGGFAAIEMGTGFIYEFARSRKVTLWVVGDVGVI